MLVFNVDIASDKRSIKKTMKTTGLKSNVKFVTGLTLLFFSFGILNQPVFADDPVTINDPTNSSGPTVSATGSNSNTANTTSNTNQQDSTQQNSPLSSSTVPPPAQSKAETGRLVTEKKMYLGRIVDEIGKIDGKKKTGLANEIARVTDRMNEIQNYDLPLADALNSKTRELITMTISSVGTALTSLPDGYNYSEEAKKIANDFITNAQSLLSTGIPQSYDARKNSVTALSNYVGQVKQVYTDYQTALTQYSQNVPTITTEAEFETWVNNKPNMGALPTLPSPVTAFPPQAALDSMNNWPAVLKRLGKEVSEFQKIAQGQLSLAMNAFNSRESDLGDIKKLLKKAEDRYKKEPTDANKNEVDKRKKDLQDATDLYDGAVTRKKNASDKLDRINKLLQKINSDLQSPIVSIRVTYGLVPRKRTFVVDVKIPIQPPAPLPSELTQILTMEKTVLLAYVDTQINEENTRIAALNRAIRQLNRLIDRSPAILTVVKDTLTGSLTKSRDEMLLPLTLPPGYTYSEDSKKAVTDLQKTVQGLMDSLPPSEDAYKKSLKDRRDFLQAILSFRQRHRDDLVAYRELAVNTTVTTMQEFKDLEAKMPRYPVVFPQSPSGDSDPTVYPPTSIDTFFQNEITAMNNLKTQLKDFQPAAKKEFDRQVARLKLFQKGFDSATNDLKDAQTALKLATTEDERTRCQKWVDDATKRLEEANKELTRVSVEERRADEAWRGIGSITKVVDDFIRMAKEMIKFTTDKRTELKPPA